VKFRITRHSGTSSPADALDQLCERLGARRDGVSFSKAGTEISATWLEDEAHSRRTAEERAAIGRQVVLDAVYAVCEKAPDLDANWFAVSIQR
jgi:hypothetical protein